MRRNFSQGDESLEPIDLAHVIVDAIADKQGEDIVLLDLRNVSLIADYFVIASAETDRQINAIENEIAQQTKNAGQPPLHTEGDADSGWVLLDYGSIIVHLFSPEMRAYYRIEEFWKQAPVVLRLK